jgi:NAD(P)-dependent dehydrogenase (short-subunit alcohol dehydrogenase family)
MANPAAQRVAIVTAAGSTGGLGKAIASALARAGNIAVVNDLDEKAARETADIINDEGHQAIAIAGDVSAADAVQAMVDETDRRYGRVDILVNCAGIRTKTLISDIRAEEIDRVLAVNLKSVILCTNAAAPIMKRRRFGRIVSMGSTGGRCGGGQFMTSTSIYGAAKAGIGGFSRSAARELGPFGVTVNVVAPFLIDVPGRSHNRPPEMVAEMLRNIPMNRLGTPEDVAACVTFLASDAAGYVTGVELDVNGGWHMEG